MYILKSATVQTKSYFLYPILIKLNQLKTNSTLKNMQRFVCFSNKIEAKNPFLTIFIQQLN